MTIPATATTRMVSATFTLSELHLIGKVLDDCDDEALIAGGYTAAERVAAIHLFNRVDEFLTKVVGTDWPEREIL